MATQLIDLPDVERLSPLVIRILGGNPGKVALFLIEFTVYSTVLTPVMSPSSHSKVVFENTFNLAQSINLSHLRHEYLPCWGWPQTSID